MAERGSQIFSIFKIFNFALNGWFVDLLSYIYSATVDLSLNKSGSSFLLGGDVNLEIIAA